MFNSGVLNIVIGLVFIYLLYSLLATIIQEFIATWLGLRASYLKKGISRMLDDDAKDNAVSNAFYNHPLLVFLAESKIHSKPSYLTAQNFAKVLIDLLRGPQAQPGQNFSLLIQQALNTGNIQWGDAKFSPMTLSYIKSLWADAQGDVEKFRGLLEQWFDNTMERATGWYKKKTQLILFFIGLVLAIIFNIDTVSISQKLSHNPELAAQLADNASIYVRNHKEIATLAQVKTTDSATAQNADAKDSGALMKQLSEKSDSLINSANALINENINDANQLLGLGWTGPCKHGTGKICISCNFHWWSILGWLITTLAISLGAPFWFDLLNKLMKVRNSVASSTTDENQKQQASASPTIKTEGQ